MCRVLCGCAPLTLSQSTNDLTCIMHADLPVAVTTIQYIPYPCLHTEFCTSSGECDDDATSARLCERKTGFSKERLRSSASNVVLGAAVMATSPVSAAFEAYIDERSVGHNALKPPTRSDPCLQKGRRDSRHIDTSV